MSKLIRRPAVLNLTYICLQGMYVVWRKNQIVVWVEYLNVWKLVGYFVLKNANNVWIEHLNFEH